MLASSVPLPQAHDIQNSRYVFTDASNTTCESALAAVPKTSQLGPVAILTELAKLTALWPSRRRCLQRCCDGFGL